MAKLTQKLSPKWSKGHHEHVSPGLFHVFCIYPIPASKIVEQIGSHPEGFSTQRREFEHGSRWHDPDFGL